VKNDPHDPSCATAPPVFSAPWEAQVFALVLTLRERGWVQGDEWMQHVAPAAVGTPPGLHDTTFETWLQALESLVVARGWGDTRTLQALGEAWAAAAVRTPHGQPIVLEPAAQAAALQTNSAGAPDPS
jgi:hypothetical protein